jgi:hypothetical protein
VFTSHQAVAEAVYNIDDQQHFSRCSWMSRCCSWSSSQPPQQLVLQVAKVSTAAPTQSQQPALAGVTAGQDATAADSAASATAGNDAMAVLAPTDISATGAIDTAAAGTAAGVGATTTAAAGAAAVDDRQLDTQRQEAAAAARSGVEYNKAALLLLLLLLQLCSTDKTLSSS